MHIVLESGECCRCMEGRGHVNGSYIASQTLIMQEVHQIAMIWPRALLPLPKCCLSCNGPGGKYSNNAQMQINAVYEWNIPHQDQM